MVKFVCKRDSRLMRFLAALMFWNRRFMSSYWTTIGNTIYYPSGVSDLKDKRLAQTIGHEMMHVAQFERLGMLTMFCLYVLFPLPILFSGRWFIEREPYLADLIAAGHKHGFPSARRDADIDAVVDTLWRGYLMPWPKRSMEFWFKKNLRPNR
jgi:hypothetical protein